MSTLPPLPSTLPALIKLLDQTFPLKSWPASVTLAEVHRHGGARDVIGFLESIQREQAEQLHADDD
jgi:hypothetical protein